MSPQSSTRRSQQCRHQGPKSICLQNFRDLPEPSVLVAARATQRRFCSLLLDQAGTHLSPYQVLYRWLYRSLFTQTQVIKLPLVYRDLKRQMIKGARPIHCKYMFQGITYFPQVWYRLASAENNNNIQIGTVLPPTLRLRRQLRNIQQNYQGVIELPFSLRETS